MKWRLALALIVGIAAAGPPLAIATAPPGTIDTIGTIGAVQDQLAVDQSTLQPRHLVGLQEQSEGTIAGTQYAVEQTKMDQITALIGARTDGTDPFNLIVGAIETSSYTLTRTTVATRTSAPPLICPLAGYVGSSYSAADLLGTKIQV